MVSLLLPYCSEKNDIRFAPATGQQLSLAWKKGRNLLGSTGYVHRKAFDLGEQVIMKHKLSFCEVEQLADDIFEVTINEGATIDEKCAVEAEEFWHKLRKEPYNLLVNNKNTFSYSFLGAQKIGEHNLEKKTAIIVNDPISKYQMSTVKNLKKMAGSWTNRKIFEDREEAIKWLQGP